jgi:hypothetical protein
MAQPGLKELFRHIFIKEADLRDPAFRSNFDFLLISSIPWHTQQQSLCAPQVLVFLGRSWLTGRSSNGLTVARLERWWKSGLKP